MHISRPWFVLMAALAVSGCTHALRIKNIDEYKKEVAATDTPLTIGLKDASVPGDGQQLFKFVYEAMRTSPHVRQVILPNQDGWDRVDALVTVSSKAEYDGSGWNFLITFPGFLLFTHAWNGFVYSADVVTDVTVELPQQAPINKQIDTTYSLRHCCFGRGAAASSGWYIPGYGASNIIVGLFMVRYDDDVTPEFMQAVRSAYGDYIVNSVVELVASSKGSAAGTSHAGGSEPSLEGPTADACARGEI